MMASESDQPRTETVEELLAQSTLSDSIRISVDGQFASENEARAVSDATFAILKLGGAYLDLEGLDGVSIADDYSAALARVDRGFGSQPVPEPTSDEFGSGLAMTLPVRRDGIMKSHIVLDSRLCHPLVDPDGPAYGLALHTLMHEAGHVHDHQIQYRCFPGFYGSPIESFCGRTLVEFALGAWGEYIASRLSSPWGTPDYISSFDDSLVPMLGSARERGNAAVADHSQHSDVRKTGAKIASIYGSLLIRASYVLGHVDGIGADLAAEATKWNQLVEDTAWFSPFWAGYRSVLSSMYASYGQWTGVEVLDQLKTFFQLYLLACGMLVQSQPDGRCAVYFRRV
jgi:hypothetical protein